MLRTRTGNFPIGFRDSGAEWLRDLPAVIAWARNNGFAAFDFCFDAGRDAAIVTSSGLGIGSVDLLHWQLLLSADPAKRQIAIKANLAYIEEVSRFNVKNFFTVLLPEDPDLPRRESFTYAVESLKALCPALEKHGARVVLEGWPGPGAIACTPESCRAIIREVGSPAIGINYDPSHLVRMGIDPLRFLREFVPHVFHVHGKDTRMDTEGLYQFGTEQPATFAPEIGYGGYTWRYTIPGQGQTDWAQVLSILKESGYQGIISIELEDKDYNGTEEGEKRGLLNGALFLTAC